MSGKGLDPAALAMQLACLFVLLTPLGAYWSSRRSAGLRWVGRGILFVAGLVSSLGTLYLFGVGSDAGWSSDGPGALVVMLVVLFLFVAAGFCWLMLFFSFGSRLPGEDE